MGGKSSFFNKTVIFDRYLFLCLGIKSIRKRRMDKPVLVFDLDETLIATSLVGNVIEELRINTKLLHIIHEAKRKGALILLLTNNPNKPITYAGKEGNFVELAVEALQKEYTTYGNGKIFDSILTAEGEREFLPVKNGYRSPVKSIRDVAKMLEMEEKYLDTKNIYFFDDLTTHELCGQSNFIHINPPFRLYEDRTDYTPLNRMLNGIKGGRRKANRTRRKLKDSRHCM